MQLENTAVILFVKAAWHQLHVIFCFIMIHAVLIMFLILVPKDLLRDTWTMIKVHLFALMVPSAICLECVQTLYVVRQVVKYVTGVLYVIYHQNVVQVNFLV